MPMRMDGAEFRNGWREGYDVDGTKVVVEARHFRRNRPPTPHEHVVQMMRGRGPGMVQDPVYEWGALLGDGRLGRCTIRPTPSGMFQVAGLRHLYRTIEEAVRGWAAPIVARATEAAQLRTERASAENAAGPRP